jgi:hypothetical protein
MVVTSLLWRYQREAFYLMRKLYLDRLSNRVQDLCKTKLETREILENETGERSSPIPDLPVLVTDSIGNHNVRQLLQNGLGSRVHEVYTAAIVWLFKSILV